MQRDNNKTLMCRAENTNLSSAVQEDEVKLNVYYPPRLRLELGKLINLADIEEGDSVYFECHVNSNPPAYKVVWKHNGVPIQGNTRAGVILITQNLAFQQLRRSQAGNYSCVASNVEGDGTSNVITLNVMCEYHVAATRHPRHLIGRVRSTLCSCDLDTKSLAQHELIPV
ncbi:hypothetical protein ONE63_005990 [Megalurothrips usitatus]|uniref:Ig-like domain-containing protein n=1 Tax=Megalurothrips usitatus TaxID=439358 RepID=A0AAV7XSP1_9NEOP|nr:hypothetical protein ONE63_005990 [Megalurothrips usitatus]